MIKTVIIDDEPASIEIIEALCYRFSKKIEVCGTATSIKKGIEMIQSHQPQLVFLDIELPEGLGFDVLKAFPELNFYTVFVTAFEGYAIEAIKHQALDYILKPVDLDEFRETLTKVSQAINNKELNSFKIEKFLDRNENKKIGIPTSFGFTYLKVEDIVRIEADGSYSEVFLANGKKYVVSRILKNFQTALEEFNFVRVHRGHLVNLNYIESLSRTDGGFLKLLNGDTIPIARKEKELIFQMLSASSTTI